MFAELLALWRAKPAIDVCVCVLGWQNVAAVTVARLPEIFPKFEVN